MWHSSLLVLADFSPKVFNILRVGSITCDIMEEQDDNHLPAVQKHSNMVILTDPWWSHGSLPKLILPCSPVQWRAVLTHSLPEEAAAKPEASKHQYHKHLMFKFQCIEQIFSAGRFHSSHLLWKPKPALSLPSASSKAKRSCWLHLWEELLEEWHQIPTHLLTWEAASTAANPDGLSEPPLPNSCTGYFLLNQGLSIFSQRKAFLNSHTPRGLSINWTLWTTSGILPCYIYYQGKEWDFNRFIFNLF